MYQSRLHATNGLVSIALDALNGELLELVSLPAADNIIKSNCHPDARSPFMLELVGPDGSVHRLLPPRYTDILEDSSLKPDITIQQQAESATIQITYPAVVEGNMRRDVQVVVDILLPQDDMRSQWHIRVENNLDTEIQRVIFPYLTGMFLGDTWEDDTLYWPQHAGLRVRNPVRRLSELPQKLFWKWQEYRYGYGLNGPTGTLNEYGSYVLENRYSGPCSMLWMDLQDETEGHGLYMTCRNNNLHLKAIRAETFGEASPGMGLSIVHFPCLAPNNTWNSETCVVALHEGGWHWAADDYRSWRTSITDTTPRRHRPEWFMKSPGLVAHYDFKYQGGGIVHRFRDIPGLLEQAQDMGLNHLLISGWHLDGFDNGFPKYTPDPDLGTEEELRDAVQQVRKMGGHLAFYINSRLCNTQYEELQPLINENAIMRQDGTLAIENYGAANMQFACLCNQSTQWRNKFVGVVDYLTNIIGADSMYLDQLAMAAGPLCYHPNHPEHANNPAGWNQGYQKMLTDMRAHYNDQGVAMLYEGASDIHGWGVSGQLISTMFFENAGGFPELYKYTFPDQVLVDMMNPRRNSGMRAEIVARKSTYLLFRAFVMGSYLWVYDLEQDNTFRRDPEQYERLQRVTALRSAWLSAYGHGLYRDVLGLGECTPGVLAKAYTLPDNRLLVACANEHHVEATIEVVWNRHNAPNIVQRTDHNPSSECLAEYSLSKKNSTQTVCLHLRPDIELAVFVLK